jgi:Asp-tRNA(Asn)/Glu-tRNA(Gln) amidotransferase C subunit
MLIPAPALKVVLSRSRDADNQVDTPNSWREAGGVEDLARSVQELMNRENDALTRSIAALSQYNKQVQKIEVEHAASVSALATSLKVRDNVRQKNLLPDAASANQRIATNLSTLLQNQKNRQQGQLPQTNSGTITPTATTATGNSMFSNNPRPAWITNWIQKHLTNQKPTPP